jgi:predicted dehydrogenase
VGAGRAGASILGAIAAERLAVVDAIVDPSPPAADRAAGRPAEIASYLSIDDLPADDLHDVAVVAVPTPLHADVLTGLLVSTRCPPLVLCEKPLTTTADATRQVRALAAARGVTLRTLLHFATAPEVVWSRDNSSELQRRLGPCVGVRSDFGDDYVHGDLRSARERLGDPWIDSGVNSLSVVLQTTRIDRCIGRKERGDVAVEMRYRGARGEEITIATAWDDPKARKTTRLVFRDGTVKVDHYRGAVVLGDEVLYRSTDEPPTRRYGRLMAKHLRDDRSEADDKLEADVMSWLFATPVSRSG